MHQIVSILCLFFALFAHPTSNGQTVDKIALENHFIDTISEDITIPLPVGDYLRQTKDLYVADYGCYMLENVRFATYAVLSGGQFLPLVDWNRAKESALTLLTTPLAGEGIVLNLEHLKYSFEKANYEIPLPSFLSSCIADGCAPYVGIEELTEDAVVASLFLVNEEKQYNHVLKLTIPRQVIVNHAGHINGTLHTYVPMGNVAELYAK